MLCVYALTFHLRPPFIRTLNSWLSHVRSQTCSPTSITYRYNRSPVHSGINTPTVTQRHSCARWHSHAEQQKRSRISFHSPAVIKAIKLHFDTLTLQYLHAHFPTRVILPPLVCSETRPLLVPF
jgi:hypothetical protein